MLKTKGKKEKREKKRKACFRGGVSDWPWELWVWPPALTAASESESKVPPPLPWSTSLLGASLNNGTGHCQIRQETGDWAPAQDVSGLNSRHSVKYMQAPFVSQLAFLRSNNPANPANGFLFFPHSFGVIPSLNPDFCQHFSDKPGLQSCLRVSKGQAGFSQAPALAPLFLIGDHSKPQEKWHLYQRCPMLPFKLCRWTEAFQVIREIIAAGNLACKGQDW